VLRIGDDRVDEIRHEELISNIAVVLQETELFSFSLRENITMMRDVSPLLLERSCEAACLGELIEQLPDGLDTLIGERGYSFPAVNASESVLREPFARTLRYSCWTRRPRRSIRLRSSWSWKD
jgi:hypothetical protein